MKTEIKEKIAEKIFQLLDEEEINNNDKSKVLSFTYNKFKKLKEKN